MLKQTVAILVGAAFIGGCAHRPQTWTPMPFDDAEYAALPKTGSGVVRGQVFAKTVGGSVKKGAGSSVLLIPATKYRDQWYQETFVLHHAAAYKADARYSQFDKTKVADGDGKFEFENVPPGKYYLLSDITWEAVSDNPYSRRLGLTDTQGGLVLRVVQVSDGAVTESMLNR